MAPTLVREPFHRDGWVYEENVDGWRILAYKDRDRVRLVSRNGRDHTRRFADLAAAIAKLSDCDHECPRSIGHVRPSRDCQHLSDLAKFDWVAAGVHSAPLPGPVSILLGSLLGRSPPLVSFAQKSIRNAPARPAQ